MDISLWIIVDVSGSMNEMGKIHLQRNLCRFANQLRKIDQEKYTGVGISFYVWGLNVSRVIPEESGDIPAFVSEGTLNFSALVNHLSKHLSEVEDLRVLILSDGNFERKGITNFTKWKSDHEKLLIRTVAIGADANLFNLKKISSNETVFEAENIASAINATIWGTDEPMPTPESIAQILQAETGENWDV
jgi:hypothetical protein